MVISQASVLKEYKTRTPSTESVPGHFTADEQRKIAKLWHLLLKYLEENKVKSIKVTGELLKKHEHDWSSLKPDDYPSPKTEDEEEALTRNAWEQFTKGDTGIRRMGFLLKKQQLTHEQLVLDRYVGETTWQYIDRVSGRHVSLVPDEFFPSFAHPDTDTRNTRDVFWATVSVKSHPDIWVHRYLRSSGWDVGKALAMIKSVIEWRAAEAVDRVNFEGDIGLGLDEMRLGMSRLVGKDRLGYPLLYVRVRRIMPRANEGFAFKRYLVAQFDAMQNVNRNNERVTMLYDFTGFSIDNTPLTMLQFMIMLGLKPYAEASSVLILLVDSWLFNNLWNLVRPFLDANLGARIVFAKNIDEVKQFIDEDQLPKELGGKNTFAVRYKLPEETENKIMFDMEGRRAAETEWRGRVAEFERATKEWADVVVDATDADVEDPGLACTVHRDAAAQDLGNAELELRKFVRSKNIYERMSLVDKNGCLQLP
ncbi:phosphatidylinositol transfer protein csr1 [Coemansia erecta]|uniref:Phosphatidylinositol transfer protein csr1 n=1 Tax=Coemansia asiatica TaxID=1052880 RepID=A0A9W7XJD1_9FUNG|nr:phosphatidylinositol transfer protein csr1 [Coemansia asiatica]KAJ2848578.1 phosphatidylinositol transfer protein csr1 [Coemansia erecta]KAJ2876534.1 phosphatidylinositol transfer protein csr1 [Coemansia asiatica]